MTKSDEVVGSMLTTDNFVRACASGNATFLERLLKGTTLFELVELSLQDSSVLMHFILHRDTLDSLAYKYLKAVYDSGYYQSAEQKTPCTSLHSQPGVSMRHLLDAIERQSQEALNVLFSPSNVEKTCSMVLSDGTTVPMLCVLLHLPLLLTPIFTNMTNKKHLMKLLLKKTYSGESFVSLALQNKQQGVDMLLQSTLALDSLVLFEIREEGVISQNQRIDACIGVFAELFKPDLMVDRMQTAKLASLIEQHENKAEICAHINKSLSAISSSSSPLSLPQLNLLLACEENKLPFIVYMMKEIDFNFSYFLLPTPTPNPTPTFDPRLNSLSRFLFGRMYFEYEDFTDLLLNKLEKCEFKLAIWSFWSKHRHILTEVRVEDGMGRLAERLREWNHRWLLGTLDDRSILSRNTILETIIKKRKDLSIFHTQREDAIDAERDVDGEIGVHEGVGYLSCFFTLKFYTGDVDFLYTLGEYIEASPYNDSIIEHMVRQAPILTNIPTYTFKESIHKVCMTCGVTEEYVSPVAIQILLYDHSMRVFYI
ncbi:hypothetical protein EON65_31845, partial [archaeon]